MKMHEHIDMKGRLTIQLRDAGDKIRNQCSVRNSIVLTGRDLVAKQFIDEAIDPVSHIAVGTGSTPVDAAADSQLESELFRKEINPIDLTKDLTTTNDDKKKVMITAELDFNEGNGALTEAGLFNADSGGVMYNRVVYLPINKTSDFKLTLIWEIIF